MTLFTGMVISMCSSLHLGVRSWLIGGVTFVTTRAPSGSSVSEPTGPRCRPPCWRAQQGAMLSLFVGTLGVVRVPFHFQD